MSIQWLGCFSRNSQLMRSAALVAMAMLGAGCGMHLRPEPEGLESNISGHWRLQTPQREVLVNSLRATMEQARAKQNVREQRDARQRPEPEDRLGPPDADTDADTPDPAHPGHGRGPRHNDWEAREHHEQQEALLNAVLPSDELRITQSATQIEFLPSVGGRRRFDMGVTSTLVTNYATLHVESGWQANVFVVHSRDSEQKINIIERYQRLGGRLHMQVQVSIPDAKDQLFTADYALAQL